MLNVGPDGVQRRANSSPGRPACSRCGTPGGTVEIDLVVLREGRRPRITRGSAYCPGCADTALEEAENALAAGHPGITNTWNGANVGHVLRSRSTTLCSVRVAGGHGVRKPSWTTRVPPDPLCRTCERLLAELDEPPAWRWPT